MTRSVTLLITFEEPCLALAKVLSTQVTEDLRGVNSLDTQVDIIPRLVCVASGSGCHKEAIFTALQQMFHVKHDDLYIVCLFRNNNADEYRRLKELCSTTKPHIENLQILSNLENFSDAGLLIRNLSRKIVTASVAK